MFHDESLYPDSHTFNPGRFLKDGQINPDVRDPELEVFGHGRRSPPFFSTIKNLHLTAFGSRIYFTGFALEDTLLYESYF